MESLHAAKLRQKEITDTVNLAFTYWDDGAPLSSARLLRKAADLMDAHHKATLPTMGEPATKI